MLKKINEKKAYLLIEITNSDTKSKENILIEVKTALDKVDYKIKGPFKIQKDENENEQNAKSILIATGCDDKGWLKKQEKCDQFFTDVCLNNEFDIKLNNRVIRMNGKKSINKLVKSEVLEENFFNWIKFIKTDFSEIFSKLMPGPKVILKQLIKASCYNN